MSWGMQERRLGPTGACLRSVEGHPVVDCPYEEELKHFLEENHDRRNHIGKGSWSKRTRKIYIEESVQLNEGIGSGTVLLAW